MGDKNTGCDVVKKLVNELSTAGNISVFGLLDWDGKHEPSNRIAVLAHGKRNGLENVLLDPLILAIAIVREFPQQKNLLGINEDMNYLQLINSSDEYLQSLIDCLCFLLFKSHPDKKAESNYIGGLNLQIDVRYFETDDHELERLILDRFPFLKKYYERPSGQIVGAHDRSSSY